MMDFGSAQFWIAVLQIIAIDIMLGGDNAVVIALACRKLPEAQRRQGIFWGVVGAIGLRVVLIFFALQLLAIPFLKVVGALLLLWIGVKLLLPEEGEGHGEVEGATTLAGAIKTIIVADAVMSLDNVIAVAGAAKGSIALVIFGILVSIPIVVWGSRFVLKLMDRFPIVITGGAALLGWIAGDMLIGDVALKPYLEGAPRWLPVAWAVGGAVLVVVIGKAIAARAERARVPLPARALAQAPAPAAAGRKLHVVLAADGSEHSLAAVRHVLDMKSRLAPDVALQVDLVNVQRGVSGDVASFVSREALQDYHREKSDRALAPARALLDAAGVRYGVHQFVGSPGRVIAEFAASRNADQITMGTRGLGTHTGALLGSVTQETLEHATVPVVVVRGQAAS
jgi:YjbE family integral membrane protein